MKLSNVAGKKIGRNEQPSACIVDSQSVKTTEKGEVLRKTSKGKPLFANRVLEDIERAVIEIAFEFLMYGQESAAKELNKRDIQISSSEIRSMWKRNGLETFEKRLRTLALYILTVKV